MSTSTRGSNVGLTKHDLIIGILFVSLAFAGILLRQMSLAVVFLALALYCWTRIVQKDYVLAFAAFFALLPVWIFLKYNAYPPIHIPGTESHISTIIKEGFLLILFGHWAIFAREQDNTVIPLRKSLIGFFALVTLTLPLVSTRRFPLLLRQYVEMFVLIGVPLLAIEVSRDDIQTLFSGFLAGGLLVNIIATYHYFVDPSFLIAGAYQADLVKGGVSTPAFLGPRLQSLGGNPNFLGFITLMTAILSLGMLHKEGNSLGRRLALSVAFGSSAFVMALTRSRDDLALLVIAIILFISLLRKWVPLIVGTGFLIAGILFNWSQILTVVVRLTEQGNPRFEAWFKIFDFYGFDLLIGGRQLSAFNEAANMAIDSTYLKILIHSGIFSLLLFLIFNTKIVVKLLVRTFSKLDYIDGTIVTILVAILGGFVFWTGFFNFPATMYYWTFISLGIIRTTSKQ